MRLKANITMLGAYQTRPSKPADGPWPRHLTPDERKARDRHGTERRQKRAQKIRRGKRRVIENTGKSRYWDDP